ncbi:MAG: hypothetical protein CM15mV51_0230 [uncultured marine virus]|nr:MAG: hypothetical protein CM15mV51_0230 [uncultured marine virus]
MKELSDDFIFIYWDDMDRLESKKNKKNESKTNRKQTVNKRKKTK